MSTTVPYVYKMLIIEEIIITFFCKSKTVSKNNVYF